MRGFGSEGRPGEGFFCRLGRTIRFTQEKPQPSRLLEDSNTAEGRLNLVLQGAREQSALGAYKGILINKDK